VLEQPWDVIVQAVSIESARIDLRSNHHPDSAHADFQPSSTLYEIIDFNGFNLGAILSRMGDGLYGRLSASPLKDSCGRLNKRA
jgi:hypothetical protein